MKFGIFEHMDDSGTPVGQHFENRLSLIEAYDRYGFYAIILRSITGRHSAWRRRPACSWLPWRSVRDVFALVR